MREILFRGQRVVNKKWVEGYLFKQFNNSTGKDDYYIRRGDTDYLVIPETVGQLTGLPDKNGKQIFEGDIVKCCFAGFDHINENCHDEFVAVVEFGNPNGVYNWGFQLRPITKTNLNTDILLWVEMEETGAFIEVIGNIHEESKNVSN